MKPLDEPKRLGDLLSKGTTMMVGTRSATGPFNSRPLTVADVQGTTIRVLIDTAADWTTGVRASDQAHVTVSDNRDNLWLAMNATMTITADKAEIDELWNAFASAYFDEGRDTPTIGVLHLALEEGTYWSTPSGRVGSVVSMLKAAIGNPQDSGEHGEIATTDEL